MKRRARKANDASPWAAPWRTHVFHGLSAAAVLAWAGCAVESGIRVHRASPNPRVADLVVLNADVWTGTGHDAQALAAVGPRIAAVGINDRIRRWIGDGTKVIDAGGRRVIPGITDSHIHLVSGGLQLARLNLRDVGSRASFIDKVSDAARRVSGGSGGDATATKEPGGPTRAERKWVLGGRWSVESWADPTPPTKDWIDPVTGDTPVFLSRMDGHQGLANSAALRIAGIDRNGPADPPGGVIERDAVTGEPTGILKDAAMDLVTRHIPPPSDDELYEALLRAMAHVNSLGITRVHDVSGREDLAAMVRAHREGVLTVRIRKYLSVSDWVPVIPQVTRFDVDDDWLRLVGFKGYMDGSLGSRTAYMYRPYTDAGADGAYPSGLLAEMATPPKRLRYMIECADQAGLQSAVHAIGDEANHVLLDMYAAVARKHARPTAGYDGPRHRIEHAQHLLPEDIPRFATLGVVASMQPYHKADDGRYAEKALGGERLRGSYAFRSLIASGALVAFGSDWPVVTCDPFLGMAAAVTGRTLDGKVWIPEESISVEQALRAYTAGAAAAAHDEGVLGAIEAGKLADVVILSQDVLRIAPEAIPETRAVVTIVGGRVVHDGR